MSLTSRLSIVAWFVLLCGAVHAQQFSVRADRKDSVDAQIAAGRAWAAKAITSVTPYERQTAVATALAYFEAVPQFWPKDKDGILRAYVSEGELFVSQSAWLNLEQVMEKAGPFAQGSRYASKVSLYLGQAKVRLGKTAEGEQALRDAEQKAHALGPEAEFAPTKELADIYARQGKTQEASSRYRALARLLSMDPHNQTWFFVRSLHLNLGAQAKGEAQRDYRDALDALAAAKAKGVKNDAQAKSQAAIEKELADLQKKYGL